MATLRSKNEDIIIKLYIYKLYKHRGWIGYSLELIDNQQDATFIMNDPQRYFLEDRIEPEIPAIIANIKSLCDNKFKDYIFTPIDEKDFTLKITHDSGEWEISLESDSWKISNEFHNAKECSKKIKFKSTNQLLLEFSREIEKEYIDLKQTNQLL